MQPSTYHPKGRMKYGILDLYFVEIDCLNARQRVLKAINMHSLLLDVLLTSIFTKCDRSIRDDMIRDCLVALIYFTLENEEN